MINKLYFFSVLIAITQLCSAQHVHETGATQNHLLRHDPELEHPDFPVELSLTAAWESHYVLEGRDLLDGGSLASVEAIGTYRGVSIGVWGVESPDVGYTEYNYWLEYSYEWEAFTFTATYNYLDFKTEGENDLEYGLALTYALPQNFELSISGYLSEENPSAFYEATLLTDIELSDALLLSPFCTLGYNDGFVGDGHEGWNHFAVGVELRYSLCQNFSIGAYLVSTLAINSDEDSYSDDESLYDFVYGGISLNFAY
ncbi:MAG: hypothetical protein ACSHX8_08790 [Opitutaceae bacterium]